MKERTEERKERKDRIVEIWEARWNGHLSGFLSRHALIWRNRVLFVECAQADDEQTLALFLKYNKKFNFEEQHDFNQYERAATTAPIMTVEEFINYVDGTYTTEETMQELRTLAEAGKI